MNAGSRLKHAWMPLLTLLVAVAAGTFAQEAVPARDQVPDKYKWDLAVMYADAAAWEADFAVAQTLLEALRDFASENVMGAGTLLATLRVRDEARWVVDKLLVYASQLSDQDTRDNAAQALKSRATGLQVGYQKATAWIEPALLAIPEDTLRACWTENDQVRVYRHYLDNVLRQRAHTLPAREEELLALAGDLAGSPEQTYGVLHNAELPWPTMRDEQGQEVALSPARFDKFQRSPDRRVRRDAFVGTMATYARFQNTFAATLNGGVQRDLYFARARGFENALASVLFPDNLPLSVYTNLVQTAERHLPLLHRWAALRKKALGVDELHTYDLYQPLVDAGQAEVPYDEAVATIIAALQPLGAEYGAVVRQGFADRWIDVYETQGKRAGGYSWGSYDTPPYILVNYNGTPRDMSILAHELGHSLHSYFTHKSQPKVYGDYSGFVAEVASVVNELLLEDYRLAHAATPAERLRLLNEQIDNLIGTTLRQVMLAEFEYEAHMLAQRGEPLTAERINGLYLDTFHKYWGPDLVRDAEHGVYWARIPHFYMNHYLFRYATSYCAAVALADGVLQKKPGALDAYLGLLKSGSSDYPLELLRRSGVDMTTPAPIEAAMLRFRRLLDEFERLLGEAAPRSQ